MSSRAYTSTFRNEKPTVFASVLAEVQKWMGNDFISNLLAQRIDDLRTVTPAGAIPDKQLDIIGNGDMEVTVAHGLMVDGAKAAPRHWQLLGFDNCQTFRITGLDDTNLKIKATKDGKVSLALYL